MDAQGEGPVIVALEAVEHAEPYVYHVPLHPGVETFRVPLDQFRQRRTGAAFDGGSVVPMALLVQTRLGTSLPFSLHVGHLAFETKRPLAAGY